MTAFDVSDRGGYEYQFVDTPSDMLLCKICHLPSKEPQLSVCCGHTFCKSCLDGIKPQTKQYELLEVVTCPMCRSENFNVVANKQNERAIKNLHIFCTNKHKGCSWEGEINDIASHLGNSDGCQFEEVKCTNDCGLLLQRQQFLSHLDNECPCREVHCQYCSMIGQYRFIMAEHVNQCSKIPLPCPNYCGIDSILRENMEVHKTTCPLEELKCPNNCDEVLQRQFMTNHIETECPRRKVNCQYCQLSGEYHLITGQHQEECPKLPLHCPNECEAGSIPREDMEEHRKNCPLEVINCEYSTMGCHATMARKDQHVHEKEKMEEHLLLTKSELVEIKASYKTQLQQNHARITQLESDLKQSHAKVKELELELEQKYAAKINELECNSQKNRIKVSELEFEVKGNHRKIESELQQNHALMKVLFGEWTIQLNTRAIQLLSGDQVLPVIVRMSEYTTKKANDVDWYSSSFYAYEEGYKMQLNVVPDGYDNGKGTHLSVYLYLLVGPHDDKLPWPLKGKFKVTLLNQGSDNGHHSVTHHINGANRIFGSFRREDIWYHPRFIKTVTLSSSEYLKNDTLFFEVSRPLAWL